MKKYIITLAIALGFGMNVNAQIGQYAQESTDGFFTINNTTRNTPGEEWGTCPTLIGHGYDVNQTAVPLGSGLILLAGMGIAYGARKKSSRQ